LQNCNIIIMKRTKLGLRLRPFSLTKKDCSNIEKNELEQLFAFFT
jgi:hypothetical protein